jgi:hypothetical protein
VSPYSQYFHADESSIEKAGEQVEPVAHGKRPNASKSLMFGLSLLTEKKLLYQDVNTRQITRIYA